MRILVILSIVIVALVIDTLLTKSYAFTTISTSFSYDLRIIVFFAIAIIYSIGVYIVLQFLKIKSFQIMKKKNFHLNTSHKIMVTIQYVLAAILFLVLFQIMLMSRYYVVLMAAAVAISYIVAIVLMSLLSYRFFSWFRSNRNAVVLSYSLSSMILAINAAFTLAFVSNIFFDMPSDIVQHKGASYAPFISPGSVADILNNAYIITSVLSFAAWWISTALLLRHYSQRLGKGKYWIIIALPLSYFLMQFIPSFPNLLSALPSSTDIFLIYTIVFTLSKPVGGILFGVAFWIIVRSFSHSNIIRDYMIISAYGLILLFVSNQAIVLVTFSYPPFGLATISFMGLSSYLILVGIYSSAISVSQDTKLRKMIRMYAVNESKLLDNIGSAQMEQEIEKRVMDISKQQEEVMVQQTGLHSSLDEENVKQYLGDVIREIRDKKEP
jgi:hypothetical protein